MQRLLRTKLNPYDAVHEFGGWTMLYGSYYVLDDNYVGRDGLSGPLIITGYTLDGMGASTNLSLGVAAKSIRKQVDVSTILNSEGAWINGLDVVIKEPVLLVYPQNHVTDLLLGSAAEKIKQELRQQSVLVVMKSGEAVLL